MEGGSCCLNSHSRILRYFAPIETSNSDRKKSMNLKGRLTLRTGLTFFFHLSYTCTYCRYKYLNKRPMGHIAHLRKQFKSINKYDYIITLIQRIKIKLYENLLVLHLNKLESPSPKDALCQDWLKLAQWFWRRIF